MTTPAGMRCFPTTLATGDKVHVYSSETHLVLQLRHQAGTEKDVLTPSFKIAVALQPLEAIAIASELLTIATARVPGILPKLA